MSCSQQDHTCSLAISSLPNYLVTCELNDKFRAGLWFRCSNYGPVENVQKLAYSRFIFLVRFCYYTAINSLSQLSRKHTSRLLVSTWNSDKTRAAYMRFGYVIDKRDLLCLRLINVTYSLQQTISELQNSRFTKEEGKTFLVKMSILLQQNLMLLQISKWLLLFTLMVWVWAKQNYARLRYW